MGGSDQPSKPGAGRGPGRLLPWRIPVHGWIEIFRRIGRDALRDHIFIVSSGVAFLALFALLPTLTALFSVYGLVASPQELSHELQSLSSIAPHMVVKAVHSDLHGIVRASGVRLGFSLVLSIVVAVWVAVRGVLGIIGALNIVHGEEERRTWPRLLGTALALALGTLVFWLLALAVILGAPFLIRRMSSSHDALVALVRIARWLIIAATALVSMTVLYRFGPSRAQPRWEWLSAGSCFGTVLWLAGSAGMSVYISHVSHFASVYGSLGAIMVVMTWFFLTAFAFLLGAEFNIEIERQLGIDRGRE